MHTSTADAMLTKLKDKLGTSFNTEVSIESLTGAPSPFLLLKQGKDIAGFAVCTGNPRDCYEPSYQYFKALYADHRNEWHGANLSFVLGVEPSASDSEFFVRIETDDLFCRKFILPLEEPLERRLARLPFIPIHQAAAGAGRPLAAQTLLKQRGLSASLAKDICQPHAKGATAIVDLCLSGAYGKVGLRSTSTGESQPWAHPSTSVSLKTLSVENFRAYRKRQTFDLDADIVFLYGPNGFGKTSFFDALDFVCTGEVSRLRLSDSRYLRAAAHLAAHPSDSRVEVQVEAADKVTHIKRTLAKRVIATSGDIELSRKDVLATLTGLDGIEGDRVDVLARVFRATHLFGQRMQELFGDLDPESCSLSSDVVSRILAIEDYANGIKKLEEILKECVRRERETKDQIEAIKSEIAGAEEQRAALAQTSAISLDPEALKGAKEKARKKVSQTSVNFPRDPDLPSLRSVRAKLEAQLSEARRRRERLVAFKPMLRDSRRWQEEVNKLQEYFAKLKRGMDAERALAKNQEERLAQLRQRQEVAQREAEKARAALSGYAWQEQAVAALADLTVQEAAIQADISGYEKELQGLHELLTKVNAENDRRRQAVLSRSGDLDQARSALARCNAALPSISALHIRRAERTRLEESAAARRIALSMAIKALSAGETQKQKSEAELEAARKKVNEDARTRAELARLLDALERHVSGDACPACGAHHGSGEQVRHRMKEVRALANETAGETARFSQLSIEVSKIGENVQQLRQRVTDAETAVKRVEEQVTYVRKEIGELETVLREAAFEPEGDLDKAVTNRVQMLTDRVKKAEKELAEAHKTPGESSELAVRRTKELNAGITAKRESLDKVKLSIRTLEGEAQYRKVSLTLAKTALVSQKEAAAALAANRARELNTTTEAIHTATAQLEASQKKSRDQERELNTLQTQLHIAEARIAQWNDELELLGLEKTVSEEERAAAEAVEAERCSAAETARDAVLTLELAQDAAATNAAAATVAHRIGALQKDLASHDRHVSAPVQLKKTFEAIAQLLEAERGRIIELYTEQCGPRASVIQQRLRSVLGFGEITLSSKGARIDVRVAGETQMLVPTDFFSESQQQVLMLSLFLATFTTQTWSGFAGVLLDDPVTHFDDLNCYAFLELLAGLVGQTEGERKQFIVSTCDKRLFRLARQRLRSFGQRAKFLELTSAGREGPVVERVQ